MGSTSGKVKGIRIDGKLYKVRHSNDAPAGLLGMVDFEGKTIYIPYDGDTREDLDVIIHELLHAAYPYLDEPAIDISATKISHYLWQLGWRNNEPAI